MLSKNAKLYIEEAVNEQYSKLYNKENSNIILRRKIELLDKFLQINFDEHKDLIETMSNEIERVSIERGMISFYKVAKLNELIDIVLKIKGITITPNIDKVQELIKYRIIDGEQNIEIINTALEICNNISIFKKIEENQLSVTVYWKYISNLFLSYLLIISKIREEIMNIYIDRELDVENYLKSIIENYKNKINFKYIPSSVRNINILDNIHIEEDDDNDDDNDEISFLEINNNPDIKKIKLIGYAGVGKTTTIEYIQYQDALNYNKQHKIPVIINLITVEKDSPIEFLIAKKLRLYKQQNDMQTLDSIKEIVEFLIEKNRLNLYFDGVNEINIVSPYEKRNFLTNLEEFIKREKNKDLKIIVTDRDNSEVSILNDKNTFLIQGMTENDIYAFIEGNTKPEKVDEVKKIVFENKYFENNIIQPIMLKNLITIIECGQEVPESIEELSEAYLDAIIKRELEEKGEPMAAYIDEALTYMVEQNLKTSDGEEIDRMLNAPYYNVIDTFYEFAEKKNIDLDAEELLNLVIKMGILKEVEFQKYAFTNEIFFHIYYFKT